MAIIAIQNVYVVTHDMNAASRFYSEALGLTQKFRDGDRWTQFKVGDTGFSLSSVEEAGAGATGATTVFETDDIDDAVAKVADAGGRILSSRDMGDHGRTTTCADPGGNIFQLFART